MQTLRNVYAKLRKDVYAQYAIITQMCFRNHYTHFPCLRNYITQILRRYYANKLRNHYAFDAAITQINYADFTQINYAIHYADYPIL